VIFQSDLQKVGITASIKPYDTAAYLDQINNHKYTGTYMGGVAYVNASPGTIIANSRHLDPKGNSNTGYTSPRYIDLYETVTSEPDAAKMKTAYDQLNDLLLDESAVMPMCAGPVRMLTRGSVHDIKGSAHGAFKYNDAWKD
jgi:ABC-type transport system substrate-binding protein